MSEASSVLIGFVDQPINDQTIIDWATNKIGGEATFPESTDDHQLAKLITDQLICPHCVKLCTSICQIQCAVDESSSLRVIYVYACLEEGCNHFTAVRHIHHQQPSQLPPHRPSNQKQVWDTDSSNWSDDDENELNLHEKESEDQEGEESEPSNVQRGKFLPKRFTNESDRGFKPFYIYVETLEDLKYSKSFSTKKESKYNLDEDGDDPPGPNEEGEKYENPEVATIFANDKASYKFYKSLRDWPKQIIRYSWKGRPLLNKSIPKPPLGVCSNCGGDRSFEFQLMPGLISQLKPSQSTQSLNIDFGTVLVFCCSNNCDNQPFNEEKCIFLEDVDNNVVNGFVSSCS